jgi:hypothetical protein
MKTLIIGLLCVALYSCSQETPKPLSNQYRIYTMDDQFTGYAYYLDDDGNAYKSIPHDAILYPDNDTVMMVHHAEFYFNSFIIDKYTLHGTWKKIEQPGYPHKEMIYKVKAIRQ